MAAARNTDTIVAPATPPGRGGVGIVRVSGPLVADIARGVVGRLPRPRVATRARFRGDAGDAIDDGLALYFAGPASFTGEDVLELHGHGGPVVVDRLVARCVALGARRARPGEFSERAFLNGKLDLAQAEAVADLIDSASVDAARAAMRSLAGEFSTLADAVAGGVADLRAFVEAAVDFPDEDVDFLADGEVLARAADLVRQLDRLADDARQGALLRDGLSVVIAGAPNAGKSSLLNRLAGHDAAIVTPAPGTTRDALREDIVIDGVPLRVVDTAGLRDSDDPIEREGVARARGEIARADRVLLVVDATAPVAPALAHDAPTTVVRNKVDLTGEAPGVAPDGAVAVSALTGAGLDALRAHLLEAAGRREGGGTFSARRRHLDALARARTHITEGIAALEHRGAAELFAEELRLAGEALGEIAGRFTTEDLLGRIFGQFCIGK